MPLLAPDQDLLDQDERVLTRPGRVIQRAVLPHRCSLLLLASVVTLLTACSSADGPRTTGSSSTGSATASTDVGAEREGPVGIGDGREIYLECHGTGSPTVVLVSGLGDGATIWSEASDLADPKPTVYDGVAEFTRVCAYDRPGTSGSRSTAVAQPTSAQTSADDLEKMLTGSGEAGPFVLVGHSYGGPIIRVFAHDHPRQVSGLVLVDALSEDLQAGLTAEERAVFERLNAPPPQPGAEFFDLNTVVAELRQSARVPDVPVTVLTADIPQLTPQLLASGQLPPGVDQEFADALWAAQMAAQRELPAKFQHAVHITNTGSDHYIQLGNPRLVIDSVREVVHQVRSTGQSG
jgi:pimeloyl-ACP methyl ester carboxylesterase